MLWLLACTSSPEADPIAQALALAEPGPYGVSYSTREISWDSPIGPRTLHLASWAPSNSPNQGLDYRDLVESEAASSNTPIAEGSFPLAIFSHGHQGYAEVSSFLMEHLASHGWVVLAPDHSDNTLFDGPERTTEIYWQRPMDLSAVLDWSEAPGQDVLAGHIGGGVVAMGHSFGGYTMHATGGAVYDPAAMQACVDGASSSFCSTWSADYQALFEGGLGDPRVKALVSMAPGDYDLFGAGGLGEVVLPTLHMTASEDSGADAEDIWAALNHDKNQRVVLQGAGHQGFTDFSGNLETGVTLSPEEGWRIIDGFVLAWALAALGDETGRPILDGRAQLSEAAERLP